MAASVSIAAGASLRRAPYLGEFTWAQLQAAYPNASATLAALPAGTRAYVTDWAAEFVPDPTGAFWRPTSGRLSLAYYAGAQASPVATLNGSGATQLFTLPATITIPANLLRAGCRVGVSMTAKRTTLAGAPGAGSLRAYVGTAGTSSDAIAAILTLSATLNLVGLIYMEATVASSTVIRRTGSGAARDSSTQTGTDVVDDSTNVNTASAMNVSFGISAGFVSGDVVQLYEAGAWVVFP